MTEEEEKEEKERGKEREKEKKKKRKMMGKIFTTDGSYDRHRMQTPI